MAKNIYSTECDGFSGPRIEAESYDQAEVKLLWLIATLQVPPTIEISGVLVEEFEFYNEPATPNPAD